MILEFSDSLDAQTILAQGAELASVMGRDRDESGARVYTWPDSETALVATIADPVLITDHHRIAQLSPRIRDTVFKLFESPRRTTSFQGTSLVFEQRAYPGVWGPNIDTLVFCQTLTKERLHGVKTALEIGCGSGFIGRFVLEHSAEVAEMHFVDINPHAVQCARDSVVDPRAVYHEGNGLEYLEGRRFDLIVCNPPYIPRPHSLADNAYEGVDLLAYFILHGARHLNPGGRIVVMTSSVAASVVDPLLASSGVPVATLARREVPLKVLNVLNNAEWMSWLLASRGVSFERKAGYDHWHTIRVMALHGVVTA